MQFVRLESGHRRRLVPPHRLLPKDLHAPQHLRRQGHLVRPDRKVVANRLCMEWQELEPSLPKHQPPWLREQLRAFSPA